MLFCALYTTQIISNFISSCFNNIISLFLFLLLITSSFPAQKVDRLDYHQALATSFSKWIPISAVALSTDSQPLQIAQNEDKQKSKSKSKKKKVRQPADTHILLHPFLVPQKNKWIQQVDCPQEIMPQILTQQKMDKTLRPNSPTT